MGKNEKERLDKLLDELNALKVGDTGKTLDIANNKGFIRRMIKQQKYFSVILVGILLGAVCETLFKIVDIVQEWELSLIFLHIGMVVCLVIATIQFHRITEKLENLDKKAINKYLYGLLLKGSKDEQKTLHEILSSLLCVVGLEFNMEPENLGDAVGKWVSRLNVFRRQKLRFWIVTILGLSLLIASIVVSAVIRIK